MIPKSNSKLQYSPRQGGSPSVATAAAAMAPGAQAIKVGWVVQTEADGSM